MQMELRESKSHKSDCMEEVKLELGFEEWNNLKKKQQIGIPLMRNRLSRCRREHFSGKFR